MNRRSFFSTLAKVAAGFAILPAATTYARKWKFHGTLVIPNPEFETAEYEMAYVFQRCAFKQTILDHEPLYDKVILEGVDQWGKHVSINLPVQRFTRIGDTIREVPSHILVDRTSR